LAAILVIALIAVAWSAWRWYEHQYPSWTEEVRLLDGRVIAVTQTRKYFDKYGTDQSWVTFSLPEMGGARTWHSFLVPMRVDVYNGKVYVLGRPRGPKQFQYYNYPKHYIVSFTWSNEAFVRVPLQQVPERIRVEENIYPCVPNPLPEMLTLKVKDDYWCLPQGERNQFGRRINLDEYNRLATSMARLSGGPPISE
jgi:hypothetical protein